MLRLGYSDDPHGLGVRNLFLFPTSGFLVVGGREEVSILDSFRALFSQGV